MYRAVFIFILLFRNYASAINLEKYDHLDPQKIVPTQPLTQALEFFETHDNIILNKKFITIVDYTKPSNKKRMFIIEMSTGLVTRYLVAHGKNSDPDYTGIASKFGDEPNSLMTAPGFYLTLDKYYGKHGLSLRLLGLSETNKNALDRAIVLHSAPYVNEEEVRVGRSWGCPVIDPKYIERTVEQLRDGSLLYLYSGSQLLGQL